MTKFWDIELEGVLYAGDSLRYPGEEGLYYENQDGIFEIALDITAPAVYPLTFTWIEVREADLPELTLITDKYAVSVSELEYIAKELDR